MTAKDVIKILIADDHAIVREGLKSVGGRGMDFMRREGDQVRGASRRKPR